MSEPIKKTVRDYLATFGDLNRIVCEYHEALDVEVAQASWGSTAGTGALQGTCGGDILVTFIPVNHQCTTMQVHLVRDDWKGVAWDSARGRGEPMHVLGPRPHARMRIAVSA